MGGLQVRTIGVDTESNGPMVAIRELSFRPGSTTWLVVLAWLREAGAFHPECLLIPTNDVRRLSETHRGTLRFHFTPGSRAGGRLTPYRIPLAEVVARVADLLA